MGHRCGRLLARGDRQPFRYPAVAVRQLGAGRHGRRGGGAQALHTEGELAVFSYRRCVILNGIDTGAMQADLADRLLPVDLALITEEERQAEEDLWPSWREAHPLILGAPLDLVSDVMARLPAVTLERQPRMADFARVVD